MDNLKVLVRHWRLEHDDADQVVSARKKNNGSSTLRGWYCWAFTNNDQEFECWMKTNCPTAYICHKFNSGHPMYTVYIKDEAEAAWFSLKWC